MTFLTGTGRHRAQIVYFLWMQIGSRTPSGIGLGSGSRLRRMRRCLVLPRELWIEIFGKLQIRERTDTAIWRARLRAVDRREHTGTRPRSEKRAAIEQRQRA